MKKNKYKQLSSEQRYTIACLLKKGATQSYIAEAIGVHRSTISREIKRNKSEKSGVYSAQIAQTYTDERKEWRKRKRRFSPAMKKLFEELLVQKKWSPEQIAGRCKLEGVAMVGKTTLYNYLHEDKKKGGKLYLSCRHSLRYRRRKLAEPTKWSKRKSIEERPNCIDKQLRIGDFEMDTIIGKGQSGAILTLVDRKTGYAIIEKLTHGKNAEQLARTVNRRLAFAKRRGQLFSITTDNGTEFTKFKTIERSLGIPVYFAKPYCSNDKPHIEHLNKLIRQYIPKQADIKTITEEQVRKIEDQINKRPRKKLNYRTPFEVFYLNLKQCCTCKWNVPLHKVRYLFGTSPNFTYLCFRT